MNTDNILSDFSGKSVALLGAGITNMPLAYMLAGAGAHLAVYDKKEEGELGSDAGKLKSLGVKFVCGKDYLSEIRENIIFRSPGIRPDHPAIKAAVDRGATLTSEMEIFLERRPCFVIGVTGSDGKSTTTTVISKMLEEAGRGKTFLGGNIGFPLLPRLGQMTGEDSVAAELSSFQLMTISSPVDVAVITNISPNHLDWHTGMDEYIGAKKKLLHGCRHAVLNYGSDITRQFGKSCSCPVTYFSSSAIPVDFLKEKDCAVFMKDGDMVHYSKAEDKYTFIIRAGEILLPALHNFENYAAAAGAVWGRALPEHIANVAKTFTGVPHRLEFVRKLGGVSFYNSSIDSSPSRTAAAISALKGRKIVLILGGYDKNIPFEPLADAVVSHGGVKKVVLTGATAGKIEKVLKNHADFEKSGIGLLYSPDFDEAVRRAASAAVDGDAVLLSPACASFDAFENFEKRGERFKEIVLGL